MKEVRLEDIIPKAATFTLARTKKTYHLRPVSLADEVWLKTEFGDDLQKIFSEINMVAISRIVFRLLEDEDKAEFAQKTVTIMNEQGEKAEEKMGGASLLHALISGFAEKMAILQALLQTIGISRPVADALVDVEKKKVREAVLTATGVGSSMLFPPSTDGQPNTSEAAHFGKLPGESRPSTRAKKKRASSKRRSTTNSSKKVARKSRPK